MTSRGTKEKDVDPEEEEEEEEDGEDTKIPTKEIYHLGYLHSWPLVGTGTSGTEVIQIPKLDFEAEKGLLMDSLKNSNKKIRVRMEAATSTSLQFLLTAGCRALHYTGHGQKDCLAFEDGAGKMHRIDSKTLKKMVSAGQKVPKFVLVSACHSETSGLAFVEAGVPHVIAVRSESQIQDKSSQVFMQALYTGLWFGDTIQTAFRKGVAAVMAAPHQTNLDEHRQFLLLPEYKNHNVRIFDDIEEGSWINDSPKPIPHMIPILTEYFQARNIELQKIVSLLQHSKKRLVTITAEEGMGKSTIAIAAARYAQERRFFEGVYFIELAKIEEGDSIASFVDSYLEIPGPTPTGPVKTSDLCAKLKEKKFLFVLDEGDDLVAESKKRSPRCLRTFIEDILTRCGNIKMLVTCRSRLGGMGSFASVPENLITLETLAPTAAAQMFWDYASREVTFKDLHCSDIKRFSQNLAQHEVLKLLGGHPGKIYHTAQLLSPECKFDDLPAKIKEMEDERKSREEDRKKEKALRLETPTGGGPTAGEVSTPTGPSVLSPPTPVLSISRTTSLQRVPSKRVDEESESERAWRQEFGDQTLVAWSDFKQFIQRHFIVAAKVDYRPLSAQDLATIKRGLEQGGVKDHVSLTSFQGFWPWWLSFEKAVGMIRAEWCRDNPTLIFGLCSRDVAAKQLEDSPVGTFLLRFSETQSGKMALAYVDSAPPYVKHSLIDIKSTGLYMNVQEPTKPVDYPFASLKELVTDCRLLHKFYPDHDKREVFVDEDDGPH